MPSPPLQKMMEAVSSYPRLRQGSRNSIIQNLTTLQTFGTIPKTGSCRIAVIHLHPGKYQDDLQQCGLLGSIVEVHMDSEFEGIRQMEDPPYWALDTLYHRLLLHREKPASAGKRPVQSKPESPKKMPPQRRHSRA